MNLLVTALKAAIDDLARAKQLPKYRVEHGVNARGSVVIALILPGESMTSEETADEKRTARAGRGG